MKFKIKNLDKAITTLRGGEIIDASVNTPMTFRNVIIAACELHRPMIAGEGIKAYNIGMKFMNAKEDLLLEKDELEFLRRVIENSSALMSIVVGKITDFLKEAEEVKVDK